LPTQAQNPNGVSIGSAVFAQLTVERSYTLQLAAVLATSQTVKQEGQHPLTGQRAANFRLLANQ